MTWAWGRMAFLADNLGGGSTLPAARAAAGSAGWAALCLYWKERRWGGGAEAGTPSSKRGVGGGPLAWGQMAFRPDHPGGGRGRDPGTEGGPSSPIVSRLRRVEGWGLPTCS